MIDLVEISITQFLASPNNVAHSFSAGTIVTQPRLYTGAIRMAIIFLLRKQEIPLEIENTLMVKDALLRLGYSSETHLVVRDGELLNDNEALRDGDRVKLIPVISGG
jgi:sulfur carrier protein ThiS